MPRRVVLVHSPPHGEVPFRHIGLAFLRAVLREAGHETVTKDVSAAEGEAGTDVYDDLILYLSERVGDVGDGLDPRLLMEVLHPEAFETRIPVGEKIVAQVDRRFDELVEAGDVFLFATNIITYYFAARMARRLRAAGRKTAVGGPSVRFAPIRDLLLRCGAFDAALEGEGEPVVARLVDGLRAGSVAAVPGAAWLDGDTVRANPCAPPPDLEALPTPYFDREEVRDFVPILAARGCASRCSYCSEPFHWKYRRRSPEAVVAEMDAAAERYGCTNFHFHDDTINEHLPWFDRFLDLLIERKGRYRWESFCGPMGLDEARLTRMRRSGCVLLKMGVQSFHHGTLEKMRRTRHADRLKEAIVAAEKVGISMHYDMLICFPGESEAAHRANLQMIEDIFAETESVYFSLNPFYLSIGSETHLNPEKYGVTLRYFDPDTLPDHLAPIVRAAGPLPVGMSYDLSRETILRRIEEMGEVLKRHGRDYLYLGQNEVPKGSGAYQDDPERGAGEAPVAPIFHHLLRPWRPGEARAGWTFRGVQAVAGGEDGLAKYVFEGADGAITVSVRLAARDEQRPCFVRTNYFNVFYDAVDGGSGPGNSGPGSVGHGSAGPARPVEALLRGVVSLVSRNEGRIRAARQRARGSA